jgi:Tfp pilus assembly protein PilV
VLVALVVFVVIAGATMTLLIQALRLSKDNSDRIIAANIARSQVEELRAKGTSRINPGLTIGGPPGTNAAFTVRTTANWTAIGQATSSCLSGTTTPNYLRLHVEVTSPTLSAPEVVDALVQPDIETSTTSTITVSLVDQAGKPVSDAQVTATDTAHTGLPNNFTYTTGDDGCLLIPGLTAPATLSITISKAGYIPITPGGTTQSVAVQTAALTTSTFTYAAASGITFGTSSVDHPIPGSVPISWKLNATGASTSTAASGSSLNSLWPLPTGFTAWLGSCSDADPEVYSGARQQYTFTPGATTAVAAAAAPVLVRGLHATTSVTANYIGPDASCAPRSFNLGTANSLGLIKVGLPYGLWSFTGGGQTWPLTAPLRPATAQVQVNFTLDDLDNPSPSPGSSFASSSAPASPSASPSTSPSATPTP